ncbi:hypothetical protein MFFC18_37400 [Mariniblastus fucicola]|uniref:Uncharacterized protein n=1 Tax=Mariniblastus fucicola TaxID=980251 RepID=A0A5B9PGW0_9BACT|nr:hypothetical protein MFFC18_37400 [Mariniblastus fucicola]
MSLARLVTYFEPRTNLAEKDSFRYNTSFHQVSKRPEINV